MPRFVRPFWLELSVDGRKTKICTGPRRSDGGFKLLVKWRDGNGNVQPVGTLSGQVYESADFGKPVRVRELFWDAELPEPKTIRGHFYQTTPEPVRKPRRRKEKQS